VLTADHTAKFIASNIKVATHVQCHIQIVAVLTVAILTFTEHVQHTHHQHGVHNTVNNKLWLLLIQYLDHS